jgi:hypothetical protein
MCNITAMMANAASRKGRGMPQIFKKGTQDSAMKPFTITTTVT